MKKIKQQKMVYGDAYEPVSESIADIAKKRKAKNKNLYLNILKFFIKNIKYI